MKGSYIFIILSFLISLPSFVVGLKEELNFESRNYHSQHGIIVNEKKNAYISIEVQKPESPKFKSMRMVAIICNILDLNNIQYSNNNKIYHVCTEDLMKQNGCNNTDKATTPNLKEKALIKQFTIDDKTKYPYSTDLKLEVEKTGYYITILKPEDEDSYDYSYNIVSNVEWHSSTGELDAANYPKIKFYGCLSLVYIVISALWLHKIFKHLKNILTAQYYITGIVFIATLEMIMYFLYYQYYNITNENSILLLCFSVGLSALRNSLSLFVLLIVCMGYSIIRESLGKTMIFIQILTVFHLIFCFLNFTSSMIISKMNMLIIVFLIFPFSLLSTIFYYWILSSLRKSIHILEKANQEVRLKLFLNIKRVLMVCFVFFIIFLGINAFTNIRSKNIEWISNHWQSKWWWSDGYISIIYLCGFTSIIYLWRPIASNQKYGFIQISSEIFDDKESSSLLKENSKEIHSTEDATIEFNGDLELDNLSQEDLFVLGEESENSDVDKDLSILIDDDEEEEEDQKNLIDVTDK